MKPPCVRRGWPNALLLHAHKGGQSNPGGEAKGTVVHPYSHDPTFRRETSELGRCTSGRAASKGQQWQCKRYRCVPVLPRPTFRWGRPSSGRHTSDQAKRHQTVHARTPTPPPFGGGRPSYKATCTTGRADARRSDGGDARG